MSYNSKVHPPAITQGYPSQAIPNGSTRSSTTRSSSQVIDARVVESIALNNSRSSRQMGMGQVVTGIPVSPGSERRVNSRDLEAQRYVVSVPAKESDGGYKALFGFLFGIGVCSFIFYFVNGAGESAAGEVVLNDSYVASGISSLKKVQSDVERAISIGAPAYNVGDIKGCAEEYQKTATGLVNAIAALGNDSTNGMQRAKTRLESALDEVKKAPSDHKGNAWELRYAFDAVLLMSDSKSWGGDSNSSWKSSSSWSSSKSKSSSSTTETSSSISTSTSVNAAAPAPTPAPATSTATAAISTAASTATSSSTAVSSSSASTATSSAVASTSSIAMRTDASASPMSSLQEAKTEIESAISVGVPLFNSGDEAGCARVYLDAAKKVVAGVNANSQSTETMQQAATRLQQAVTEVAKTPISHYDNAWTLRYGFDEVLAMVETNKIASTTTSASSVSTATASASATSNAVSIGSNTVSSLRTPVAPVTPAPAVVQMASLQSCKDEIQNTISIGAPMYNSGDIAGCARIYLDTAKKAVAGVNANTQHTSTMKAAANRLQQAVDTVALTPTSDDDNAWTLRYGFDEVLGMSEGSVISASTSSNFSPSANSVSANSVSTSSGGNKLKALFSGNFNGSIVNDGVMGGLSSSSWNGNVFQGTVRTENNGGFASVRFSTGGADVRGYTGFYVKGQHLSSSMHTTNLSVQDSITARYSATNFKKSFQLPSSSSDIVYLPFSDAEWSQPLSYGQNTGTRKINLDAIMSIGIQMEKPVRGFMVRIDEIGVYEG